MPLRLVFADTFYWVALLHPRDAFHAAAVSFSRSLRRTRIVTTDEVFTELLNAWSAAGPYWRGVAAALALYEARPDKGYSLTDCRSMAAMRTLGLTEVLTNDHHFTQEGFTILFP